MSTNEKFPIDEAEWEAQERGMRAALGRHSDDMDAAARSYRTVVDALISHPRSQTPDDFAAGVVAAAARNDAGVESLLSRILLVVFLVASTVAIAVYGSRCWNALDQRVGDGTMAWILAGLGCVVLSWICGQFRRHAAYTTGLNYIG